MSFLRPVSHGWWFVTAYILLILCVPVINPFIQKLSKRTFVLFLLFIWAFYYSIDYVFGSEYLSFVRAFFFYVLGAFVRFYFSEIPESLRSESESVDKVKNAFRNVGLFLVCIATWAIMSFCSYKTSYVTKSIAEGTDVSLMIKNRVFAIADKCVSLPLFAFCFFRLFASLKIGRRAFINKIASATFGVYLIHDSGFGRSLIWNHIFKVSEVQFASKFFPIFAVADILIVFFVCVLIDLARQKFFETRYSLVAKKIVEKFR